MTNDDDNFGRHDPMDRFQRHAGADIFDNHSTGQPGMPPVKPRQHSANGFSRCSAGKSIPASLFEFQVSIFGSQILHAKFQCLGNFRAIKQPVEIERFVKIFDRLRGIEYRGYPGRSAARQPDDENRRLARNRQALRHGVNVAAVPAQRLPRAPERVDCCYPNSPIIDRGIS